MTNHVRLASLCALGVVPAGCATRQSAPARPLPDVVVAHADTLERFSTPPPPPRPRRSDGRIIFHSNAGPPPALFVVDGRRMSYDEWAHAGIDPAAIDSLWIFKGDSATARYGEGTAAGVIVIITRRARTKP